MVNLDQFYDKQRRKYNIDTFISLLITAMDNYNDADVEILFQNNPWKLKSFNKFHNFLIAYFSAQIRDFNKKISRLQQLKAGSSLRGRLQLHKYGRRSIEESLTLPDPAMNLLYDKLHNIRKQLTSLTSYMSSYTSLSGYTNRFAWYLGKVIQ